MLPLDTPAAPGKDATSPYDGASVPGLPGPAPGPERRESLATARGDEVPRDLEPDAQGLLARCRSAYDELVQVPGWWDRPTTCNAAHGHDGPCGAPDCWNAYPWLNLDAAQTVRAWPPKCSACGDFRLLWNGAEHEPCDECQPSGNTDG